MASNLNVDDDDVVIISETITSKDDTSTVLKSSFNEKTIDNLCKKYLKDGKGKMNDLALKTFCEYLRIYSLEAFSRAAEQAMKEGSTTVNMDHFEKVIAQFVLDFS